jgi:DNA-binding Xre family transcriptional regulator
MFCNLYSSSSALRNHNFCSFLQPVERVTEDYIVGHLKQSYLPRPYRGLEPYFDSLFELTLSADCCASFIRANPELPIRPRDYYLSKLFQFLYEALVAAYGLDYRETEVRDWVEEFLDSVPNETLDGLWAFDISAFHSDSTRLPLEQLLGRLREFLPKNTAVTIEGEKESPAKVIDRLRGYRTMEALAAEAGMDIKQVYKIKRGEGVHTDTVRKLAAVLGCKPGDLLAE